MEQSELKRETTLSPAYDRRKEGFGVHGVELHFMLSGPTLEVYVFFMTDWCLNRTPSNMWDDTMPDLGGLGWHTSHPQEGEPIKAECSTFDGKPCWGGMGLPAPEPYRDMLLKEGSDGVWKMLEAFHAELLKEMTE